MCQSKQAAALYGVQWTFYVKPKLTSWQLWPQVWMYVRLLWAGSGDNWDQILYEVAFFWIFTTHTAVIRKLRPEFKFPAKIEMAFSQILAIRS